MKITMQLFIFVVLLNKSLQLEVKPNFLSFCATVARGHKTPS